MRYSMYHFNNLVLDNELPDADTNIIITDLSKANQQLFLFKLTLASENFPKSINLTIKYIDNSKAVIRAISQALYSGRFGKEVVIVNLVSHHLSFKDARSLSNSMRQDRYPLDFELNLRNNTIRNKGLFKFTELIKSCTRGFKLNVSSNLISYDGIKKFATDLTPRGSYPPGMHFDLSGNGVGNSGLKAILNMLEDQAYGMGIILQSTDINDIGALYLAFLLQAEAFHCGFSLDIGDNFVTDKGLEAIINSLNQGNGPPNLCIKADQNCSSDDLLYHDLNVALNHHNHRRTIYIGLTLFQSNSKFNLLPVELAMNIIAISGISFTAC